MVTCLNCGKLFKGNFCPNCGQKAGVERLTAAVLLHETMHFFLHFEKGFIHTAWGFLARPGRTAIDFLSGKRKQFQPPVSYILILTGAYILLHNFIINHYHYHYNLSPESVSVLNFQEQSNIFLRTNFTPFILIIMLCSALVIYPILGRKKYNFVEILTICLYGGGTYFLMLIISDLILGVVFKINTISMNVFIWQTFISSIYNFWFCFDFFKRARLRLLWPRLIITAILISVVGWVIMNYLPMLWIYVLR